MTEDCMELLTYRMKRKVKMMLGGRHLIEYFGKCFILSVAVLTALWKDN
jgi:hypothetical protein